MGTHVEGIVLAGASLTPREGRVVIEDGTITAIEEVAVDSRDIIMPALTNAHTHIGDSVAKDAAVGLGLHEAVAPPDSLKHRRLRAADRETLITAMRRTMRYMATAGTATFLDFREFGVTGATALREAADGLAITPFIFGSDDSAVLEVADGYGASGANDADFAGRRAAAREAGKPFAIHAGEPDATDIHPALDLDPDLLVHMVHADADHRDRVAEQDVPVVVCPRANAVLGVGRPPVADLHAATDVALGTDNVMLNGPNLFREMAYTATAFDLSARTVLRMATRTGPAVVGHEHGVLEPGRPAALLVLDGESDNLVGTEHPVEAVVRRAGPADIKRRWLQPAPAGD